MLANDFRDTKLAVTIYKDTPQVLIEEFTEACLNCTGTETLVEKRLPDFVSDMLLYYDRITIAFNYSLHNHLGYSSGCEGVSFYRSKGLNVVNISDFVDDCVECGVIEMPVTVSYDDFLGALA